MPKIVINEIDNTTSPRGEYTNFTVVVPGPIQAPKECLGPEADSTKLTEFKAKLAKFDLNGIYEFTSQKEFREVIGVIEDGEVTENILLSIKDENNGDLYHKYCHYGNKIAYELLGLGYTVLYKAFYIPSDYSVTESSDKYFDTRLFENTGIKSITEIGKDSWWKCLEDKAEYDFRYLVTGFIGTDIKDTALEIVSAYQCISNIANIRKDCTALIDINAEEYEGKKQSEILTGATDILDELPTNEYTAIFAPYVKYSRLKDFIDTIFPASFHYLACAAKAAENYNEWYAIAGYTRGVSKYTIESVGCTFGEAAIETFEPRQSTYKAATSTAPATGINKAVNLIVKIKNNYYLWGNRTAAKLNSNTDTPDDLTAKHFLNIRQLCTTIKKQVYVACRRFTFDPNSDILWLNFCNAIKPTLEKMRADQGIADYKLSKVKAPKATLRAKIRIVPIEAVEDFEIDLFLEDSLNGTVIAEQ